MARTAWKLWITTETVLKPFRTDRGGMAAPSALNPRRPDMTPQLLDEIHPGEILLEEFMKPLGITARQLAADMDVPPSRISDIVNGTRPITADTALRLGLFFSMDPRYWLNLQTEYDMRTIMRESHDRIAPRIRVFQPAAV